MQSTHTALLNLPHLPHHALLAHVFPQLQHHAIISITQLCDSGCIATFTKLQVLIHHNKKLILHGHRHPHTGLWYIRSPSSTQHCAFSASITSHKCTLASFYHRSCFSPTTSAFTKAIDAGFFATWPGLTSTLISHHLPRSISTIKGHLRQQLLEVIIKKPHYLGFIQIMVNYLFLPRNMLFGVISALFFSMTYLG